MLFLRQLPTLIQALHGEPDTASAMWRFRLGRPRRRLAAALAGLWSLTLAAATLAVALRLDSRLALVFAPALLLTLVLVHDLGRSGQEASGAV